MLACLAAWLAPSPAAATGAEEAAGRWSGRYSCGHVSNNAFTLTLEPDAAGQLAGELRFDVPRQPGRSGAYRVRARYSAEARRLAVDPTEWIERPPGYTPYGLSGVLHENGLSMAGELRGCVAVGHPRFVAQRDAGGRPAATPAAPASPPASAPASAPGIASTPLAPPATGPMEGHWRGRIACASLGDLPLALTVLQDGEALAAVATLGWPVGNPRNRRFQDERSVLFGDAAGGQARLAGAPLLDTPPRIRSLAGRLDRAGTGFEGEAAGLPANWRCGALRLTREGPPALPELRGAGLAAGSWAGFDLQSRGPGTPDALEQIRAMNRTTTVQARITLAGEGAGLHGRYEVTAPVDRPPARQDRYGVGLRPLLALPDGRIAFAPMAVERAEGRFAAAPGQPARAASYLLVIAADPSGALAVERLLRRGGNAPRATLLPVGGAARAALDRGEAPALPLPEGIGGGLAAAPSLDAQCGVLQGWARPLAAAGDPDRMTRTTGQRHALALFEDAAFQPVFGLAYGQTTQAQRSAVALLAGWVCTRRLESDLLQRDSVTRPLLSQAGFDELGAQMMNRRDSAGWLAEVLQEIEELALAEASTPRLAAIEAEARRRAPELAEDDRARLAAAIAARREAIAAALLMERVAALPGLPETPASIPALQRLLADAQPLRLAPEDRARLRQAVRAKAEAILRPMTETALAAEREAPKSLDGLARLTAAQRPLDAALSQLAPAVELAEATEAARRLRAQRRAMMAIEGIQQAFRAAMLGLAAPGDPRATARAAALRYVDAAQLEGSGAVPAYAQAVREAIERLEIAAIRVVDRSAGRSPGEPSVQAMLLAVKDRFDAINAELSSTFARCQRRQFQNDPVMAMECLTVLAAGAGSELRMSITRFEKIGCADPAGLAGFVCDYVLGFESSSPFMQGRMAELLGGGSLARGRFVPTTGGWLFTRLQ